MTVSETGLDNMQQAVRDVAIHLATHLNYSVNTAPGIHAPRQRNSLPRLGKGRNPAWARRTVRPVMESSLEINVEAGPCRVLESLRQFARDLYAAVQPPSIARLAPVICAASSLHRYSASEATCSTVINSFVG